MTTYRARLVSVHDQGTRLEPVPGTDVPDEPTEVNVLALGVAIALGAAGFEHHPEPRDPQMQTLEALVDGSAVIPWRPAGATGPGGERQIVCERRASSVWTCHIETEQPADG